MTTTNDAPARTPLEAEVNLEAMQEEPWHLRAQEFVGYVRYSLDQLENDLAGLRRAIDATAAVQGTERLREAIDSIEREANERSESDYNEYAPGLFYAVEKLRAALAAPEGAEPSGERREPLATLLMIRSQAVATLTAGGDSLDAAWIRNRCDEAAALSDSGTGAAPETAEPDWWAFEWEMDGPDGERIVCDEVVRTPEETEAPPDARMIRLYAHPPA